MISSAVPVARGKPYFVKVEPETRERQDCSRDSHPIVPLSFVRVEKTQVLLIIHVRNLPLAASPQLRLQHLGLGQVAQVVADPKAILFA